MPRNTYSKKKGNIFFGNRDLILKIQTHISGKNI